MKEILIIKNSKGVSVTCFTLADKNKILNSYQNTSLYFIIPV